MNPCEHVESLLSIYQEDETSPSETRYVAGHLTACKSCRTTLNELDELRKRLEQLPEIRVSDGFTGRVLEAAMGTKPAGLDEAVVPEVSTFWSVWGVPLQAAAVLVLATFLGVQWWQGTPEDLAGAESPLKQAIETANQVELVESETVPQKTTLSETYPQFRNLDATSTSIGLAGEELALEDWALSTPQGGGQPVLTRVGTNPGTKVVVTY